MARPPLFLLRPSRPSLTPSPSPACFEELLHFALVLSRVLRHSCALSLELPACVSHRLLLRVSFRWGGGSVKYCSLADTVLRWSAGIKVALHPVDGEESRADLIPGIRSSCRSRSSRYSPRRASSTASGPREVPLRRSMSPVRSTRRLQRWGCSLTTCTAFDARRPRYWAAHWYTTRYGSC